ncbi:MAG TPA: PEP-CTERM sorting domain-containing protein, partial [Lacipirellulaceae bacterium]
VLNRSTPPLPNSAKLLASNFALFGNGGVLRFNTASNQFEPFVTDRPELRGAANLLVVGDDLYVAAGGGGRVGKFDANTGALDTTFAMGGYIGPDVNFGFPASLALGPGGNSILVGVLGSTTGDSRIEEFDFNGNSLGVWAMNTHDTNFPPNGMGTIPSNNIMGFSEPTGIVFSTFIPEPSSAVLGLLCVAAIGMKRRRKGSTP